MATMSLSPADQGVLGALAHNQAAQLDQLHLQPEWLESDVARAACAAGLQLYRLNKRVSIINVMTHPLARHVPRDAWGPVIGIFQNGYGDVDAAAQVRAAHDAYVVREADKIRAEMNFLAAAEPYKMAEALPGFTQRFNALYSGAKIAKTKPSDVYEEDVPEIKFLSRIPEMNAILGGGYRNGMLFLYLGPPGHGKSSAMRTDIVNALLQKKRVSLIVTENTTVKALHGILRALTGLTEVEITKRVGNTPERDAILKSWVKWCDDYLFLYGAEFFKLPAIERILAWDKPDLLVIDYVRKMPGMTGVKGLVEDPVGDFCYGLLDFSNHFGTAIISAGQMSADNAKKFESGKFLESAPSFYGTDRPRQATDLYVGVRRKGGGSTSFFLWKDRYGGPIHIEKVIPFDAHRQALKIPGM